jgi:ABC-type multidrug transport system fused ATPase/permease subunit
VIAHRLSTVRDADQILVMKGGELVEQGKFDELVRRNGLFAELNNQGQFVADAVESAADTQQESST